MVFSHDATPGDADQLPKTFEPQTEPTPPPPNETAPPQTEPTAVPEKKPEAEVVLPPKVQKLEVSELVSNAQKIMDKEGRRIGTACNKFVLRVLEVTGFKNESFIANDFDDYAKKNFSHYKVVHFERQALGDEVARLQKHLWSYPERTPFIMQWSRSGAHGHIAIVERIGEKLIIFQASLNQYTARKDQTTVNTLLSGYNRRVLSVYSELTPR